jgi:hypothetical protein
VIEVLPARPETLIKGSVKGLLARTFAKVNDLNWDMSAKTVDLTVTSRQKQDITLIARSGIQTITAPAGVLPAQPKPGETTCTLRLPQGTPVMLHMKMGSHTPSDWIPGTASH